MPFTQTNARPGGVGVILCLAFDHRASVKGLRAFKEKLVSCPLVLLSIESSGAFDLIVQAQLDGMAAYHQYLERLAPDLRRYVTRYETSFISETSAKGIWQPPIDPYPKSLWIYCAGEGHRRIAVADIDRISAERDYMRLHMGPKSCLTHSTALKLMKRLDPDIFVRIHRSTIVRKDFVERIVQTGRNWAALLGDGTAQPISRTYVDEARRRIMDHSSNENAHSSKLPSFDERYASLDE